MNSIVLIIDDDPIYRKITDRIVKISGLNPQPIIFPDGLEALTFLQNNRHQYSRYIIFLDINMPRMNGWEFLENFELENFLFKKDIYLITSSIDKNDHAKAKANKHIKDILIKPLTLKKMISLKESILVA